MQIMYMSILNHTKKRLKKKIKNAKTHGNNSYKKRKIKKRKNNTENKKRKKHFKNKTMKNKKMKKILFRVKKKIMDEIEGNIQKGGDNDTGFHTEITVSTTKGGTDGSGNGTNGDNNGAGNGTNGTDGGAGNGTSTNNDTAGAGISNAQFKKSKLEKILGDYKLIQFHK